MAFRRKNGSNTKSPAGTDRVPGSDWTEGIRLPAWLLLGIWLVTTLAIALLPRTPALAQERDNAADKTAEAIPCFVYHRFGDTRYPSTNISLKVFESQLQHLRKKGYTVLNLGQAVSLLRSGDPIPERSAVLTVDDGYRSFLTGAMPLLREYGYPATLFVQTDNVGDTGYLDWEDLRRLQSQGIEIGNHSASHAHFLNMPPSKRLERFRMDVQDAQEAFASNLKEPPDLFSYPYGEYTPGMQDVLRKLGFAAATAQKSGVLHPEADTYALPRFPMGGPYATLDGFISKVGMLPLKIRREEPGSPVVDNNPPTLTLDLVAEEINLQGLQCFVDGRRECRLQRDPKDPSQIMVQSTQRLKQRRTMYTITAPSAGGSQWHWYSHLWIRPEIAE